MADDGSGVGAESGALKAKLSQLLGADHVSDAPETLLLHSQDIWAAGPKTVALVVSPGSVEDLSRAVAAIEAAGYAIAPRGAGMSYTGGYIPTVDGTVSLDMSRMNRILSIRPEDMTVTVEAGCTWRDLNEALKPHGLRTPFWGPMSGLVSTIGGGLSQLNAMFGAGYYGTSSESVIALTVVLAGGQILRTGARGPDGDTPFYRHYGPDLAGLFCGDCGVFGVKAEVTLRLIRAPAHEAYASFSFKSGADLLAGMAELARAGLASEMCAFDPGLTRVRMKRAGLVSDVKTLGAVIAKQKSPIKGVIEAAKIAMAGRNFMEDDDFPLHITIEGRSAAGVAADLEHARKIAADCGGREIENTIAKVIRAQPFPPLNSMLGPEAERWAPVHGVASLSLAPAVFEGVEAVFADMAGDFERVGVATAYLFTSVSTNALILEPVFYWPEARLPIHEASMEPDYLAKLPVQPENPAATAVVTEARKRIIAVFQSFGCGHFQIGRSYPYRASRDEASWALIESIKAAVDPAGVLNPGVLGLYERPA
jgi:FAD/FMN-containing dehydrogenase